MNPSNRTTQSVLVALTLFALTLPAHAAVTQVVESFSTRHYCDSGMTSALWDSVAGELKLPLFQIGLVGSGDTPGSAYGLAMAGNYVYVADGNSGLQVFSLTASGIPVLVGENNTAGTARGVSVPGNHAFVADGGSGLAVLDVTNPSSPALAGSYDTPGYAYGIAVAGDYAYIADGTTGLVVLHVNKPVSPTLAGTCNTPGTAFGVALAGNYAFVADGTMGLQVINITNPESPTLAGTVDTPDYAYAVAVSGDHAYVADGSTGLLVFDITRPTNPSLVATSDTPGTAVNVAIEADAAYVADGPAGLREFDITHPGAPVLQGSLDTPGNASAVAVQGNLAGVADGTLGLRMVKISLPQAPTYAGGCSTTSQAYELAIDGDYAYVAAGYNGLRVVDITDPTAPVVVGVYVPPVGHYYYGVDISGDYAFMGDEDNALHVLNISEPTAPLFVGACALGGAGYEVAVDGDYAYVAASSGLEVVNISNPTSPTHIGSYASSVGAYTLDLAGDHAYLADSDLGILVIDISDPAHPELSGSYNTPGSAQDIAVAGDYAYVADLNGGVQVLDIANPAGPVLVDTYHSPGRARGIAVAGNHAFVLDESAGLLVIDISNPASPTFMWSLAVSGFVDKLRVEGDRAYVVATGAGLEVLNVFQRFVDPESNYARSLALNDRSAKIAKVRFVAAQTDSIRWHASADDGIHWLEVPPNNTWVDFQTVGTSLKWASELCYLRNGINPTCTDLTIQWAYQVPLIDRIADVSNDQGRQVRIGWTRNASDVAGVPTPVTEYAIFRRIDAGLAPSYNAPATHVLGWAGDLGNNGAASVLAYPPGDWDFVLTVPANCEETYSTVVPTLADSTGAGGTKFTSLFVRARTATPSVFFDSPVDSGYSVDNLPPAPPAPFTAAYQSGATHLHWGANHEPDLWYYMIHRGTEAGFVPGPGNLVAVCGDTGFVDTGPAGAYYKLRAVDVNGNASGFTLLTPVGTTSAAGEPFPDAIYLASPSPNPATDGATLRFGLPRDALVSLRIYDVSGRVVRELAVGAIAAGERMLTWDLRDASGNRVRTGVFFVRFDADGVSRCERIAVVR